MRITILLLAFSYFVHSTKTSSHFVRYTLREQQYHARVILTDLNLTKIYVFDTSGHFLDVPDEIYHTTVYRNRSGEIAVLNSAAQACFWASNTYNQYSNARLLHDSIGLYLDQRLDVP